MSNGLNSIPKLFSLQVEVSVFTAGSCRQMEKITIRDGVAKQIRIPALFACIRHPQHGLILFDTGYADHFFHAAARFPYCLYKKATPVQIDQRQTAIYQLQQAGIDVNEIKYIILSHFHADHIAGLRDFPAAKFIFLQSAYDAVKHRSGISAVRAGFLPHLLPVDFVERSLPLDESKLAMLPAGFPFERGIDVFGDGGLIAVDLPGHAAGQIGILCQSAKQSYFLCADAAWSSRAYRDAIEPHWIAGIIMDNRKKYRESFQKVQQIHKLYPQIRIIPSHCAEVEKLAAGYESETGEIKEV